MGTFTMRLGEVLEHLPTVWDTETPYEIFDEVYRDTLNQKIIDHYMYYEIGQETIGQFKFALNRKMREIMPYYNQVYKSQIEIDPLATVNLSTDSASDEQQTTEQNSTNTNTASSDSSSRSVSSDTPQTQLAGDEDYATSAADAVGHTQTAGGGTGTATGTNASNGTVNTTIKGSQGHAASLLMQYRKSLLNVDLMVIAELETLFMAVWENGDENNSNTYGGYGYGRGSIFYGWTAGI